MRMLPWAQFDPPDPPRELGPDQRLSAPDQLGQLIGRPELVDYHLPPRNPAGRSLSRRRSREDEAYGPGSASDSLKPLATYGLLDPAHPPTSAGIIGRDVGCSALIGESCKGVGEDLDLLMGGVCAVGTAVVASQVVSLQAHRCSRARLADKSSFGCRIRQGDARDPTDVASVVGGPGAADLAHRRRWPPGKGRPAAVEHQDRLGDVAGTEVV